MRRFIYLLSCLPLGWSLASAVCHADEVKLPPPANRQIDFVKDVQPIFAAACYSCHGSEKQKSSYRLDAKASALASGDIGQAIVPGKSAESPLIHYVAGLEEDLLMPAEGERLTDEQIGILRAWIDQGANWPDAADVKLDTRPHWSLLPLAKPAVPAVRDSNRATTPVDAFLLSALEAKGMTFSPPADRPHAASAGHHSI